MKTKSEKITPFQVNLLSLIRDGNHTGKALAEALWPKKKRGKLAQAGRWQAAGALVKKLVKRGMVKIKPGDERPEFHLTAKGTKALAA